ncbi:glycoside hydrolase family 31 protein, partial [Teratosphaeria destructans]
MNIIYTFDMRVSRSHGIRALLALLPALAPAIEIIQTPPGTDLSLGNDFTLHWQTDHFDITQGNTSVWSTVPGKPFVGASAGNDLVTGSNGAFNITNVDENECQSQNVLFFQYVDWEGTLIGSAVQVRGQLLNCGHSSAPYSLTFWIPEDRPDQVSFYLNIDSPPNLALKKLYFRWASHADEDFYGLGAQASFASLKNQSVPIFSREQGTGRGDQPLTDIENSAGGFAGGDEFTTYTAIASYVTTDGRMFYLSEKSTAYANFNLTQPDAVTLRYDSLSVDGGFAKGNNMFEAVEQLTAATGRMPHLPEWVDEGAILGVQGGQEKVNAIVEQGLKLNCPIAAVWLQDWVGTHSQAGPYVNLSRLWWNWENDEQLYPTWTQFVQDLRTQHNVRTLSYINVFLANVSTKPDGYRRNLYDEATALQYFIWNTTANSTSVISSGPGLSAGIIDLTNPGLVTWFKEVMKTQVWNSNISGYMSDFGEYTPVTADTKLYDMVSDAFFAHDQYPLLWSRFQRELIEELGLQNEAVIFHRSAATGSNRYQNLFWVGDQDVDWGKNDGIKSAVTIMAHMGLSGYAHLHSDVGGYTVVLTYNDFNVTRSAELLGRWGELAAISSAVFRSHEGNIPSVNAQFYS